MNPQAKPRYVQFSEAAAAALAATMSPAPIGYYVQYKLVQTENPTTCITKSHQDDEETKIAHPTIEALLSEVAYRVCDAGIEYVFGELADPDSDLNQYNGGPLKLVREMVFVFDLDQAEQAEFNRLQAEHAEDNLDVNSDEDFPEHLGQALED